MGNLKPVGSEKLQGMAKINRIMEIARYKENKPKSINETSSNEYSIKMSDGYNYFIVKEKNGYVIKRGLNESNAEYLAPMQNTKYFSSYSQAFKKLNLMAKEINSVEGERKNISLFTEGESMDDKRYFLKHPKMGTKMETMEQGSPTQPPTQATAPVPAPAPAPAQAPAPQSPPADLALPQDELPDDEMGDEEMPDETSVDSDTEETQPSEEKVTFKTIQKLTGKLAQKIRTLSSDEENPMSSKDIKYVINSILSALDLESLDEDDREQIISKMEGLEDEESTEELPSDSEEDGNEESEEIAPEAPQPPAQEVPEGYNSIDEEDFYMSPKINKGGMNEYDSKKMDEMIEGIFSESKVDKVLQKYFKYSKKEKINNIIKEIDNLSESASQRVSARKFYNKNKNINLLGKSDNGKLIFMNESNRYSIDKYGRIL